MLDPNYIASRSAIAAQLTAYVQQNSPILATVALLARQGAQIRNLDVYLLAADQDGRILR